MSESITRIQWSAGQSRITLYCENGFFGHLYGDEAEFFTHIVGEALSKINEKRAMEAAEKREKPVFPE